MRCCSEKIATKPAFSLVEVLAALAILALISSSVLVVINRCMASAANSTKKMQAFEVARENMEKLLCSDSVTETVEYGGSDKYPDIQWQSTVDSFYEPITERMWIRAVCSAQYTDTDGQPQTVELMHWLTDISKEQMLKILQDRLNRLTGVQVIDSIEEAAEYAGVDVGTIEQWLNNDMRLVEGGEFGGFLIKSELDLYKRTGGSPSEDDRAAQAMKSKEGDKKEEDGPDEGEAEPPTDEEDAAEPKEPETKKESEDVIWINGQPYSRQELEQMSFSELWQLFMGGG